MTNVFGLNGRTWIVSTASKNRLYVKMSMGKAYKQAIKRVFGEKYLRLLRLSPHNSAAL